METYKTRAIDWTCDFTFNCYVPVSVDDINHLNTYFDILRLLNPRIKPEITNGRHTFFFGNHPIRYVRVSGYVVNAEYPINEKFPLSKIWVNDGTTDSPLECVIKSAEFAARRPVKSGSLVCFYGSLAEFDHIQVEINDYSVIHNQIVKQYYRFRQEAMLVRKHVLEWPAEAFEYFIPSLKPGTHPKTTIIDHANELDSLMADLQQFDVSYV